MLKNKLNKKQMIDISFKIKMHQLVKLMKIIKANPKYKDIVNSLNKKFMSNIR
jgi:hypothetical protein